MYIASVCSRINIPYLSIENIMKIDRSKSIAELEQKHWGPPTYSSSLVRTCTALRSKPLQDFGVEDLRIMIGQENNLAFLVPIALEFLHDDILVAGDMYNGDLLMNILRINPNYWLQHPNEKSFLLTIIRSQWTKLLQEQHFDIELRAIQKFMRPFD